MISAFAQWTNLGLNEYQVNDLTIHSDTIYASTDNGIYKKNIHSSDTVWSGCGKQGSYIVQTLVKDYQTFISLVQLGSTNTTQIIKSVDGGLTFSLMNSDTSNTNSYQFLDHIAHPTNDYDTLYFLNHRLKTNNGGITWENIYNTTFTDRFIMVNPANHKQLLIGGETGYFSAYLQLSNDFGYTWTIPAMNSFFSGDNAIHDMAIENSVWYAAGEGVIAKSTDGGENWFQLLNLLDTTSPFSLYYTNIEFSPVNCNVIYVTGLKSAGSNRVPLLFSEDKGVGWDTVSCSSVIANQRIRCMTIININNTDNVFLGGNGVYLFKKIVNNVPQQNTIPNLTVYPNPAIDKLYVKTDKSISGIRLHNAFGHEIFVEQTEENIISINNLPDGLYVISFTIDDIHVVRKFIKKEASPDNYHD